MGRAYTSDKGEKKYTGLKNFCGNTSGNSINMTEKKRQTRLVDRIMFFGGRGVFWNLRLWY
jgi:hypothetical protein